MIRAIVCYILILGSFKHTSVAGVTQQERHRIPFRVAIVVQIPDDVLKVVEFDTMLYGSWKYIQTNKRLFFDKADDQFLNIFDLLVFYNKKVKKQLPEDCEKFYITEDKDVPYKPPQHGKDYAKYLTKSSVPPKAASQNSDDLVIFRSQCWKIPLTRRIVMSQTDVSPGLMIYRKEIHKMLEEYDFVLQTETDTFLSPKLFTFDLQQTNVAVGFNMVCEDARKKQIAKFAALLHVNNTKIECIGSSILARTELAIYILQQSYSLSRLIVDYKFDGPNKSLSKLDAWIYAKEITLNQLFSNFEKPNIFQLIDSSSCSSTFNIYKTLSISCHQQQDCEFSKDRFFELLASYQTALPVEKNMIYQKIMVHTNKTFTKYEVRNLKAPEFSKFIAYRFSGKLLQFLFNKDNDK